MRVIMSMSLSISITDCRVWLTGLLDSDTQLVGRNDPRKCGCFTSFPGAQSAADTLHCRATANAGERSLRQEHLYLYLYLYMYMYMYMYLYLYSVR